MRGPVAMWKQIVLSLFLLGGAAALWLGQEAALDWLGYAAEPGAARPAQPDSGVPVIVAPVATGVADNETFNVNGDTAAGAIAGALRADRLLLLTDVAGVKSPAGEVVTELRPEDVHRMIAEGTIALAAPRRARMA